MRITTNINMHHKTRQEIYENKYFSFYNLEINIRWFKKKKKYHSLAVMIMQFKSPETTDLNHY